MYFKALLAVLFLVVVALPLIVLKLALVALGYPLVAIGLLFAKEVDAEPYPDRVTDDPWKMVELPKWINYIWGSDKYGAEGNWFWNDRYDNTSWWSRFMWLAVRNPVSNLKNVLPIYKIDAVDNNKIEYIGDDAVFDFKGGEGIQLSWYYAGGFKYGAGFHYVHKWKDRDNVLRFRLGYKFQPNEKDKISTPTLTINFAPNTKV